MTALTDQPLFEFKNRRLEYQEETVLDNLSLSIYPGERVALVGGSGAGKSTLLKALCANSGLTKSPGAHSSRGWCQCSAPFTIFIWVRWIATRLFITLGNLIKPLPAARREVSGIARSIDLEQQLYSSVDKLSGGQQQRTSIGRALIQQRPIFIGDEPVANVDEYQAERLLRLICQQHQTVVLALHDIEQALQFCTRIIGLKDGAIALDAASDQLTASDLASLYDAV